MVDDPTAYRVDGEVGRLSFACHHVVRDGSITLDTSRDVFPALSGKEWYRTVGYRDLAIRLGVVTSSYRHTRQVLEHVRHQPGATPLRTLHDAVEAEGREAAEALDREARRVLQEGGMNAETLLPAKPQVTCQPQCVAQDRVDAVLRELAHDNAELVAELKANPVRYEDPDKSVNISLDDVVAKKQKEQRERPGRTVQTADQAPSPQASKARTSGEEKKAEEEKKRVHATVAHVQIGGESRMFASAGLMSTLLLVVACIVANRRLLWNWMCFLDGQQTLHDLVLRVLGWQGTLQLILDWYHLVKKCKECLSLALNNRHIRNEVLVSLLRLLWYGRVDAAIAYLRQIAPAHIKAPKALERLIGYLERNRPYIPCYAARKKLGLRNSSNRVEKSNDIAVSTRQKHKGMSWSQVGSTALAVLRTMVANDTHRQWFEERTIDFCFAA